MKKGLQNLVQAYQSAQKEQGTDYFDCDDSGVGLDEEQDNPTAYLPDESLASLPAGLSNFAGCLKCGEAVKIVAPERYRVNLVGRADMS